MPKDKNPKDKSPKAVSNNDTLIEKAKVVKEVPTGTDWKKVTVDGKEVYVRRTEKETPPTETPATPPPTSSTKTKYKGLPPSNKPKPKPKPKDTPKEEDFTEEVVMLEGKKPVSQQTGLFGGTQTYENIDPAKQWGADYGITTIETPDAEGRFTNTSRKYNLDKEGREVTYDEANPLKNFKNGKFVPTYTGRTIEDIRKEYTTQQIETPSMSGVNKANPNYQGSLMMPGTKATRIAGGGAGEFNQMNVGKIPGALSTAPVGYVEQKYDAAGNPIATPNVGVQMGTENLTPLRKGEMEVGKMYDIEKKPDVITSEKFSKGGKVKAPKMKKYYDGTPPYGTTNPYQQNNIVMGGVQPQYVVPNQGNIQPGVAQIGGGQGQYGTTGNATTATGETSAQVGTEKGIGEKSGKREKSQEQLKKEERNRQNIGEALGAYGRSYLATAPNTGSQDSATKSAIGVVSNMGAIGGVIGGVYGIIDKPARQEKVKAEEIKVTYDASGKPIAKLRDEGRAKDTAIVGSFLSPSEAIATRSKYAGGFTDVSGKGYTKYLEQEAQKQLNKKLAEEAAYKQEQAIANRNAGVLEGNVSNLYNFNTASYGQDKNLNLQYAAKGGIIGAAKMMYAKGGTIVGKGGPKDDAILTKADKKGIEPGSFIVPAENNEKAKGIRGALFGDKNKVAKFKKGGETDSDVAVSNGEHLFTPTERKKIINYLGEEILEELAPNAEENNESENEKAMGGMIKRADGSYSKRGLWDNIRDAAGSGKKPTPEMLKQEKKIKAGYYNGGITPESIVSQKRTEEIQDTYASGGYVVQRSSDREGKTHKVTGPDGTVKYFGDPNLGQHPKDPARKEAFYARHKENLDNNPHFRAYARETWADGGTTGNMTDRENMREYKDGGLTKSKAKTMLHEGVAHGKPITEQQRKYFGWVAGGSKQSKAEGGDINGYAMGTDVEGVEDVPASKKTYAELITPPFSWKGSKEAYKAAADKAIKEGKVVPKDMTSASYTKEKPSIKAPTTSVKKGIKVPNVDMQPKYSYLEELKNQGDLSQKNQEAAQEKSILAAPEKQLVLQKATEDIRKTPVSAPKKGLGDYLGRIDPTAIAAGMQVMEGKKLIQSGKRPTDVSKIDPAWNAAVERAQREASYGYTPEERAMLEQQRINAVNEARFAGRNLAGGSAGTAYQQERQAINQGWANALQLKSSDQQLRMQKQQYADQAVRDRAAFLDSQRRRAFGDAMETYNINQESGAALVGAGVRNSIGAYRYQKELEAQERASQRENAPVYNG